MKFDYYINYYSGRSNTYKLDRTTVTIGAPRMLAISTSPPSVGASSSSAMTVAGAVLSCASAATTSSAAAAAGSVLS
jgi:galactokinase